MIDICAVIVTYGERFMLLKTVVTRLCEEDVSSIVIVSNGQTSTQIKSLYDGFSDKRIHILINNENEGSAGGYHAGINYYLKEKKEDFLLLLDDDNLISAGGIKEVIYKYNSCEDSKLVFCAHRSDRNNQKNAFSNRKNIIYGRNSFLGYDLFSLFYKSQANSRDYIFADVVPYGGMVFKRKVVVEVGLPDKEYYLYSDDFEYSLRARKFNYIFAILKDVVIEDIDASWHVNKSGSQIINPEADKMRVYYTVRNGVITDLRYNNIGVLYFFNFVFFIIIQILKDISAFKFNFLAVSNWKVFFRACRDAIKNITGKSYL